MEVIRLFFLNLFSRSHGFDLCGVGPRKPYMTADQKREAMRRYMERLAIVREARRSEKGTQPSSVAEFIGDMITLHEVEQLDKVTGQSSSSVASTGN